jgi:hypothetical protein
MSEPLPQDSPEEEVVPAAEAEENDMTVVDADDDWAED